MKADCPPTVTDVPSSEVGALAPLKSEPVHPHESAARLVPQISIHVFGAIKENCPNALALTTPPGLMEGAAEVVLQVVMEVILPWAAVCDVITIASKAWKFQLESGGKFDIGQPFARISSPVGTRPARIELNIRLR
jgi:hypothetical protein